MDQTEITNNEYRQFCEHVRDSTARELIYANTDLIEDDISGEFINYKERYFDEDSKEMVDYEASDRTKNRELFSLNWDKKLCYTDEKLVPILVDMYYPSNERFYKKREIDTRKLLYKYYWLDLREAARRGRVDIIPNGIDGKEQQTREGKQIS